MASIILESTRKQGAKGGEQLIVSPNNDKHDKRAMKVQSNGIHMLMTSNSYLIGL